MSFVRTLATLAVGFAAARGVDKVRQMGGLPGVADAVKSNPQLAKIPGLQSMLDQFGGKGAAAGGAAAGGAGGGLMGMLGGAAASGATGAAGLWDSLTGTNTATQAMEANARLMIRAMIQAAKADGTIDADERAMIEGYLGDLEPDEIAFVKAELAAPLDPMALARDTAAEARLQVYSAAATVNRGDSPAEQQFLATLAQGLGIDPDERRRLHAQIGIAPPSA
jgi:uncharacterized membrane protein YebE (DUF533 family)